MDSTTAITSSPQSQLSLSSTTIDPIQDIDLPIHAPPFLLSSCPQFSNLLSDLSSNHITNNGVSSDVAFSVERARKKMEHSKRIYMMTLLLYNEVHSLLMEKKIESMNKSKSSEPSTSKDSQVYEVLNQMVMDSEASQYLTLPINTKESYMISNNNNVNNNDNNNNNNNSNSNSNSNNNNTPTLLGLTEKSMNETRLMNPEKYQKQVDSISKYIIPEIERNLMKKLECLVNFYQPTKDSQTSKGLLLAKITQLDKVVLHTKTSLEFDEYSLKKDKVRYIKEFWRYYQILSQTLELLIAIVKNYKLGLHLEHDRVTTDWLIELSKATILKMKVLEHQFLTETYTPSKVTALKSIRDHLNQALLQVSKEYTNLTYILDQYDNVGMGFKELAKEYDSLLTGITQKTWALNELRKSKLE